MLNPDIPYRDVHLYMRLLGCNIAAACSQGACNLYYNVCGYDVCNDLEWTPAPGEALSSCRLSHKSVSRLPLPLSAMLLRREEAAASTANWLSRSCSRIAGSLCNRSVNSATEYLVGNTNNNLHLLPAEAVLIQVD